MERSCDILGFGIVAVDDTYTVDGLPAPDTKKGYRSSMRSGGGLSGTALVAAARLGCSCRWCGYLGTDDLSDFTRMVFDREGIAYEPGSPHPEAGPIHSIILNDSVDGSRTLLWNRDRVVPHPVGEREQAWIRAAGCLFVDHGTAETQLIASLVAAEVGVPIVSDLEVLASAELRAMAELSDHFIIPLATAVEEFGESDPARALAKAIRFGRKTLACITDGKHGCWFATADAPEAVSHQPAFAVSPVVDTNGCGDVFHGAYAASLVKGFSPGECVRRAAAAAALKVRRKGGQDGTPTAAELDAFLAGA